MNRSKFRRSSPLLSLTALTLLASAGCAVATDAGSETVAATKQGVGASGGMQTTMDGSAVKLTWTYSCGADSQCAADEGLITNVSLVRGTTLLGSWTPDRDPRTFEDTTAKPGTTYEYYLYLDHSKGYTDVSHSEFVTSGPTPPATPPGPTPNFAVQPNDGTNTLGITIASSHKYHHYYVRWGFVGTNGVQWDTSDLNPEIQDTSNASFTLSPASASNTYFVSVMGCDRSFWGLSDQGCSTWAPVQQVRGPMLPRLEWHYPAVLPTNQFVFKPGGGIASVSRIPTQLDTFAIGYDGKLWDTATFAVDSWQPPFPVVQAHTNDTFVPGGGIAAVSRLQSLLETFAIGYDGKLWSTGWYTDGTGWQASHPILPQSGAVFKPGGGIAAVSRNQSIVDTFAIGYDGYLWDTGWWDAPGNWHAAYPVPRGGATFQQGGGIAAAAVDADHIYTFAIGFDGQLWSPGWWNVDHWETSFKVEPTDPNVHFQAGSQIAATVHDGQLDTWVIGYDGQLWNAGSCNWKAKTCFGQWTPPYKVQPAGNATFAVGGGIAAASRTGSLVDVEVVGFDSHTWSANWWGYGL